MVQKDLMDTPHKRKSSALWGLSAFISLFLGLALISPIQFHREVARIHSEPLIGNKNSGVQALKEKGFPFSFLVIGDTQNSSRAASLMKRALNAGDSSFLIILGDIVSGPEIEGHYFFLKKMRGVIKPPFPVFLVPGNHDIDYGQTKKGPNNDNVTPKVYESLYGARNFDFTFNQCLFIICAVDLRHPEDYINFLRDTLSEKGVNKRHIFVFIHFPPRGLGQSVGQSVVLPKEEEFFSVVETHKVTACFFGDYHGYWRVQRNGVSMIISGGGGRLKKSQSEWGKFHHMLRITVDETGFREGMLTQGEDINLPWLWEKWTGVQLFPVFQNREWILYVGMVLFLSWGTFSVIYFVISLRKDKPRELVN